MPIQPSQVPRNNALTSSLRGRTPTFESSEMAHSLSIGWLCIWVSLNLHQILRVKNSCSVVKKASGDLTWWNEGNTGVGRLPTWP